MSPGEAERNSPSRTEGGQSGDKQGEVAPQDPHHSMVVELASLKALEVLRGERWRTRREIVGLLSAAVIFVVAIGGYLTNDVLDTRVSKHVEATIHEELETSGYRMELAFLQFNANRLSSTEKGVTEEVLEDMVDNADLVISKYINDPGVPFAVKQERRKDIRSTLAAFIDLSASGGSDEFVNKFLDLGTDIVESSDDVTQTLVQHIGRRLIGEAGAPDVWFNEDGTPTDDYQRYKTVAERARTTGFPEVFLAFELIMRHIQKKPSSELVGLIGDAKELNETDMGHFIRLMHAHATGDFTTNLNAASDRVVGHYRDFLETYQNDSELIAQICNLLTIRLVDFCNLEHTITLGVIRLGLLQLDIGSSHTRRVPLAFAT